MHSKHSYPATRIGAFALCVAALFTACGSTSGSTITPLKTTASSATTSTSTPSAVTTTAPVAPTTTALSGDAAIFAADRSQADAYFAVASENPINVADPRIPQYASGKQLVDLRAALNQFYFRHVHLVGTYKGAQYRVAQRNGNTVLVLSCDTDTTAVVDNATGQIVEPAANKSALINTRLELINGRWMVTDSGQRSPTC